MIALSLDFKKKHFFKLNSDSNLNILQKFLFLIYNSKLKIWVILAINLFVLYIIRILNKNCVWFLLGNPTDDITSLCLIILLSWSPIWYSANIIQKYLKGDRLIKEDFKLCNGYVIEKVNLYALSFNILVNILISVNIYWLGIIVGFIFILIVYPDLFTMLYISKPKSAGTLLYSITGTEVLLAVGAILSTGLEETEEWSKIPVRKIRSTGTIENIDKGCWNAYASENATHEIPDYEKFDQFNKNTSLLKLRARVHDLLKENVDFVPRGRFKYNISFESDTFIGFSLGSFTNGNNNTLVLFIKQNYNDSLKYFPSFFIDENLKITSLELKEKFGILIPNPSIYENLVIFTQGIKIENSPFIKVWRPLHIFHQPHIGIQESYYFYPYQPIDSEKYPEIVTPFIKEIKDFSTDLTGDKLSSLKWKVHAFVYLTWVSLFTNNNAGLQGEDNKSVNELGTNWGEIKNQIGYIKNKKFSYMSLNPTNWTLDSVLNYRDDKLVLTRAELFKETIKHCVDRIIWINQDKLNFELFEIVKEKSGYQLYSIIDTSNVFNWKHQSEYSSKYDELQYKTLVLSKNSFNIMNNQDIGSIIKFMAADGWKREI
jgi:hypothetical protein